MRPWCRSWTRCAGAAHERNDDDDDDDDDGDDDDDDDDELVRQVLEVAKGRVYVEPPIYTNNLPQ